MITVLHLTFPSDIYNEIGRIMLFPTFVSTSHVLMFLPIITLAHLLPVYHLQFFPLPPCSYLDRIIQILHYCTGPLNSVWLHKTGL